MIEAGGVYVICHPNADAPIQEECDEYHPEPNNDEEKYLNGNDGVCLVQGTEGVRDTDYTILDCVGDFNADPGDGWAV